MGGRIRRSGEIEQGGYTLVELVVVVGILIVLTAIGLPFFTAMMQNSRLDAATRQIADDIREARSKSTQSGWDYKIVGFNVGGSSTYKNQYRLLGRQSGVAWPADTGGTFNFPSPQSGATQMAGPWINFNQLYQGVSLNPSVSTQSFYVSFNSRGVAFESMSFPLTITLQSGGSRQVTVTSVGGVRIQ
jgi:Tfp pilus assembly protein FimT